MSSHYATAMRGAIDGMTEEQVRTSLHTLVVLVDTHQPVVVTLDNINQVLTQVRAS